MKKLNTYIQEKLVINKRVKTLKLKEDENFLFILAREMPYRDEKTIKVTYYICKCTNINSKKVTFVYPAGDKQTEPYTINTQNYLELNNANPNKKEVVVCLKPDDGIELLENMLKGNKIDREELFTKYFDKKHKWLLDKSYDFIYQFYKDNIKGFIKKLQEKEPTYMVEKLVIDKEIQPNGKFSKILALFDASLKSIGYVKNDSLFEKVDIKEGCIYYIFFRNGNSKLTLTLKLMNCQDNNVVINGSFRYNKKLTGRQLNRVYNYKIEFSDFKHNNEKILNSVFSGSDNFYVLNDILLDNVLKGIRSFKNYKDSFQNAIELKTFTQSNFDELVSTIKKLFEL